MLHIFEIFTPMFEWHACKLAKLSACIAKCMATIKNDLHLYLLDYKETILTPAAPVEETSSLIHTDKRDIN